jgi:hypothetical protein
MSAEIIDTTIPGAEAFEKALTNWMDAQKAGDEKAATKAFAQALVIGAKAHLRIRAAVGTVLDAAEGAALALLRSSFQKDEHEFENIGYSELNRVMEEMLPVRMIHRLRHIYRFESGGWRHDESSLVALAKLYYEYRRCSALALEAARQMSEAAGKIDAGFREMIPEQFPQR